MRFGKASFLHEHQDRNQDGGKEEACPLLCPTIQVLCNPNTGFY